MENFLYFFTACLKLEQLFFTVRLLNCTIDFCGDSIVNQSYLKKKSETEFLDTYNVYSIFPFLYKILISLIVCTYFYCQFSINENCEGQSS